VRTRPLIGALLGALCLIAAPAAPATPTGEIQEGEVAQWIATQNGCQPDAIRINSLDHLDFSRDGRDAVVVNAYSCNTGTAGPDVSTVLTRGRDGKIAELRVAPVDRKNLDTLFGPGSASLSVYQGRLVLTYSDSSGRQAPVAVWYKWSGAGFVVASIEIAKSYKTSYDCSRTHFDDERAICFVESSPRSTSSSTRSTNRCCRTCPPTTAHPCRKASANGSPSAAISARSTVPGWNASRITTSSASGS
jgi:hypothetical protein